MVSRQSQALDQTLVAGKRNSKLLNVEMINNLLSDDTNKTRMGNVDTYLKSHAENYKHNRLPFEKGKYIQFAVNPCHQDEFFSVQVVTRIKVIDVNTEKGQAEASQSALNSVLTSAFYTQKPPAEKPKNAWKVKDMGKKEHVLRYETLKSDGPSAAPSFKDPNSIMESVGSGTWTLEHTEQPSKLEDGETSREYLIIGCWQYDHESDQLTCFRETVVEQPAFSKHNQRPLTVVQHLGIAYYFERSAQNDPIYCEIDLKDGEKEVKKVTIRNNSELCQRLLDAMKFTKGFMGRVDIGGEPFLAYSVWKAQPGGGRFGGGGFLGGRGRPQPSPAASDSKEPDCVLKFYSLQSRSVKWSIKNADTLLTFNEETQQALVFGLCSYSGSSTKINCVKLVQWKPDTLEASEDDEVSSFLGDVAVGSDLQNIRGNELPQAVEYFFDEETLRFVIIQGYFNARFYQLEPHEEDESKPGSITRHEHISMHNQLQLVKSTDQSLVYVCQVNVMDKQTLDQEKVKQIPEHTEFCSFHMFDVKEVDLTAARFVPSFKMPGLIGEQTRSVINNRLNQQELYITKNLDIYGPMLDQTQAQFGFIRVSEHRQEPLHPAYQKLAFNFPSIIYDAPTPMRHQLMVQTMTHPELVCILDLGEWQVIHQVKNVIAPGQAPSSTLLAYSPLGQLCLLNVKVHAYESESVHQIKWELMGIIESLSVNQQLRTDNIEEAFLLQNEKQLCVVIQTDTEIIALHVQTQLQSTEDQEAQQSQLKKFKQKQGMLRSRNDRFKKNTTVSASAFENQGSDQFETKNGIRRKIIQDTKFGEVVSKRNWLLPLSAQLGRRGNLLFYAERDPNLGVDKLFSVSMSKITQNDILNSKKLKVSVKHIYTMSDSQVLFMCLDQFTEQTRFHAKDHIQILDDKRQLLSITEQEDDLGHDTLYSVKMTIDLEKNLPKHGFSEFKWTQLFNQRFMKMVIDRKSITYKGKCLSFLGGTIVPTLSDTNKQPDVIPTQAIRNTSYLFGAYEQDGENIIFVKPTLGSRLVDCLGYCGPQPMYSHFVGSDLIIHTWQDQRTRQLATFVFNVHGRYLGRVKNPVHPETGEEITNIGPYSLDIRQKQFLLVRKKGQLRDAGLAKLQRLPSGEYAFTKLESLKEFGSSLDCPFIRVSQSGQIFNVSVTYNPASSYISGKLVHQEGIRSSTFALELCPLDGSDEFEDLKQIHIENCIQYVCLMGKYGQIIYFKKKDFQTGDWFRKIEYQVADVPVYLSRKNVNDSKEIGLKWTFTGDVIQIKTPHCLIHYDLDKQVELGCLNDYEQIFQMEIDFVPTRFFIPVRNSLNQQHTNDYMITTNDQTCVRSSIQRLKGAMLFMYDELAIHNFKDLIVTNQKGQKLDRIDPTLVFINHKLTNFFHMCNNKPKLLEIVHEFALGTKYPSEVTEETLKDSNTFFGEKVRRLAVLMLMTKNERGLSPLNLAIRNRSFQSFELMLSLLLHAKKTFVSSSFLSDFNFMIGSEVETVERFFDEKFVTNQSCQNLIKVKWTIEEESVNIVLNSQIFSKDVVEKITCADGADQEESERLTIEKVMKEEEKMKKQTQHLKHHIHQQMLNQSLPDSHNTDALMKSVTARLMDFDWLFQDGNGRKMVQMLANTENEELFDKKQVQVFIDLIWSKYQLAIFDKVFLPFLVYFCACQLFFTFFLGDSFNGWAFQIMEVCIMGIIIVNLCVTEILEVFQMQQIGLADYFSDFWNYVDQIKFLMVISTLLLHIFGDNVYLEKKMGSVAMLLLYTKLFYWMRIFESTASFIRMLKEIVIDCIPFLTFLVICIAMFANPLLMLDQARHAEGLDAPINEEVLGFPFVDAILRSYLIGLGEFGMDNYSESDKVMVWFLFLLATVVTQLVFMNLLIAIMGDTFARVQEVKERSGVKERISMVYDYIWVLDIQEEFQGAKYVLVVEQLNSNGEEKRGNQDGKLGKLKTQIGTMLTNTEKNLRSKFAELEIKLKQSTNQSSKVNLELDEIKKKFHKSQRAQKAELSNINSSIEKLGRQLESTFKTLQRQQQQITTALTSSGTRDSFSGKQPTTPTTNSLNESRRAAAFASFQDDMNDSFIATPKPQPKKEEPKRRGLRGLFRRKDKQ